MLFYKNMLIYLFYLYLGFFFYNFFILGFFFCNNYFFFFKFLVCIVWYNSLYGGGKEYVRNFLKRIRII